MHSSEALLILAELSASQWGMVTTAQAAAHGVQRLELSRLCKAGHLERLSHGVYRDAGSASDEFEGLRAAWLASDPRHTAERRLGGLPDPVVIMGASAASLHGVGDLPAERHEFTAPRRRQTQRPDIKYRQRWLDPSDVTIAHGLPVTTIERTIADLVEDRTDLSLVADVVRDAARMRRLDTGQLAEMLAPLAVRNDLHKGDGTALLNRLTGLAGLDSTSLAREITSSESLSALVAASNLSHIKHANRSDSLTGKATREALQALNESVAESVRQAIAPALENFAASIELPPLPGVEAALSAIAEHVSLNLPTQDLLASFGEEWSASLERIAVADTELSPVVSTIELARNMEAVGASD